MRVRSNFLNSFISLMLSTTEDLEGVLASTHAATTSWKMWMEIVWVVSVNLNEKMEMQVEERG